MELAPTPKDTLFRDGTAALYRFRRPDDGPAKAGQMPLLLVPSMINRWYVLDLRRGASMVEALVGAGHDTFCLDWGVPEDEDRYLTWDDVIARLGRMVRAVRRETGAPKVGILGYCMGATLSTVYTALEPDSVAALANLAGPVDFSKAGFLGEMVDGRFFDADAIGAAGNMSPQMMQAGFVALRPTTQIAKWVGFLDRAHDPKAREAFEALEAWSGDNIPFPGAAYATYIGDLYQKNALVKGQHRVRGRVADLKNITCPVLTIVAERDAICPPAAATGLNDGVSSTDKEVLSVAGGHVGAVVGSKASKVLYPALAAWFEKRLQVPKRAASVSISTASVEA
jgi:polyhydroxyalkanoate synthase subunit PhaC